MKGSAIASEILWPLGLTMAGFTLVFAAIVLIRMRTMLATAKTEARLLRMAMD
jgi:heme exporter protein C